jgi:hypothetical protein
LADADKVRIYSGNARRIFPHLDAILRGQGR